MDPSLAKGHGNRHIAGMQRAFWTFIAIASPAVLFVVGQGILRMYETGGYFFAAIGSLAVCAASVSFGFLLDSPRPPR